MLINHISFIEGRWSNWYKSYLDVFPYFDFGRDIHDERRYILDEMASLMFCEWLSNDEM